MQLWVKKHGSSSGNTKKPTSVYANVTLNENPYNIPYTIIPPKELRRRGAIKNQGWRIWRINTII